MGQLDQACQESSPKPVGEVQRELNALFLEVERIGGETQTLNNLLQPIFPPKESLKDELAKTGEKLLENLCPLAKQVRDVTEKLAKVRTQISAAANLQRL